MSNLDRAAGCVSERLTIEIRQLNISTGGLQLDIKLLRNVNHVMHFHARPIKAPGEMLVAFVFCHHEHFISVLR